MASMPYYVQKRKGFKKIIMPPLTQKMGPYIKYPPKQKYYKKLSWDKKIIEELIIQLPEVDFFQQKFHYEVENWLPFYWKNFQQTSKYTYVIENISKETLVENCETDIRRRRIRKAAKAGIKIVETQDVEVFYKLNKKTFERKNKNIPYSIHLVKKIFHVCKNKNACKILLAVDQNNQNLAGGFFVEDDNSVYYLIGGMDPENKNVGAMDLLLHRCIVETIGKMKVFDFEGSVIESVEKYFRSFGAVQKAYFEISKTNSKLFSFLQICRSLLK
jgi:lipid II:glycine glycyltransferase (peptidoglycan interpeptide bridge formation enzyme)